MGAPCAWNTCLARSIAALRSDRVDAPWISDGPLNSELFTLYVEKVLVPTLAKGDVVILDNLGSHKGRLPVAPSGPPAPTRLFCTRLVQRDRATLGK